MTRVLILFFLIVCAFHNLTWAQNQSNFVERRMENRADSVSKITDSLITANALFHLIYESKYEGDNKIYYRHYYIDTIKRYLLKCIIDTAFEDYYKRTFKQIIVYFNQGIEYKNCITQKLLVDSAICSYLNISPEENEIRQQTGLLGRTWAGYALDQKIRDLLRRDIDNMKFLQKKYSKQLR